MGDRDDWPALNRQTVKAAWHVVAYRMGLIPAVPQESCEWLQRRELMWSLGDPDEQLAGEDHEDPDG